MKFLVSVPRLTAEDSTNQHSVEADTVEGAIIAYCRDHRQGYGPRAGDVFNVSCRVEVTQRPALPLKSV